MKQGSTVAFTRMLALSLTVLLAGSCQTDVSTPGDPVIHANLFVRYIFPDQQYRAEVVFKEGDTLARARPVPAPGPVYFQMQPLEPNQLSDELVRYDTRIQGPFQSDLRFQLTDRRGRRETVTIELEPITELTISPIIGRETSFLFSCSPATLLAGEMLVLLINDVNNRAASITIEGPADLSQLELPSTQLQALSPGPASVYVVKKKDGEEQADAFHAHWSVEYYSDERPIRIQ